jgi:formamidopyrimidine-DNA glycosylase
MPELPEVQTIVNELEKKIIGLKITDIWCDWPKTVRGAGGLKNLKKETKNKKILSIRRRAKYIVIDIEGKKSLFIHQKISGHLLYGKWSLKKGVWVSNIDGPLKDERQNQYIRVVFFLSNGYQIGFSDLRRFGKIILVDDNKADELKELRKLGPEPLEISFKQFKNLFNYRSQTTIKTRRGRVKQVIMDPFFIAGIGNIYSDEILWDAGYHPMSRVENMEESDLKKLYNSIKKILNKALKYKGDSIDDYRRTNGEKGSYQNVQTAYHQTGKKCKKKDGGIIKRLKVGGRSAHYCDKHQILK